MKILKLLIVAVVFCLAVYGISLLTRPGIMVSDNSSSTSSIDRVSDEDLELTHCLDNLELTFDEVKSLNNSISRMNDRERSMVSTTELNRISDYSNAVAYIERLPNEYLDSHDPMEVANSFIANINDLDLEEYHMLMIRNICEPWDNEPQQTMAIQELQKGLEDGSITKFSDLSLVRKRVISRITGK